MIIGDDYMYYHASQNKDIKILEPRISNHNKPLIYFSEKRENVLVYLSNAVEKFCKDTNFKYNGIYSKWGPYSFDKDGILVLEEYYPNAIYETYKGVSGYIYSVEKVPNIQKLEDINNIYITDTNTKIDNVEYIEDAYDTIMNNVKSGKIKITKYDEFIKIKGEWLHNVIKKEYQESDNHPEYKYFLENKFPFVIE
jgi:hypothetical protein